MNLEANQPTPNSMQTFVYSLPDGFDSELDAELLDESDLDSVAKAPTLTVDLEALPADETVEVPKPSQRLKYIQGVRTAHQVYLITNLLGDTSRSLIQPQQVWTIGRNRAAALPLQDRKMSRRHAVILYVPDQGFYLIDLNSMNGSYVNGKRVRQRHLLQDGDRIGLGMTECWFFLSQYQRTLEPLHPEVLARLNNQESRSTPFIDFSELEEPDISFKVTQEA